jgi:type IV pilus assembly protein PilX
MVALILLVALTLGGLALFRQVGSGVLIARNLTFSNAALIASDRGVEAARNWLTTTGADLQQASVADGYFPAWCNIAVNSSNFPDVDNNGITDDCKASPPPSNFDPLGFNWANAVVATSDDGNGNSIRYVIHRLCRIPGSLNYTSPEGIAQECVAVGSATSGGSKGTGSYGNVALKNTMQPYFRVTTQSVGPNNTVVYSQAILY